MRLTCIATLILTMTAHVAAGPACADEGPERDGIGLIGASATAGWGVIVPLPEPEEGRRFIHVDLSRALPAIWPTGPKIAWGTGDPFFFRKRDATRSQQVDAVIAAEPAVVVGIDFLFWYGYGNVRGTSEAMARMAHLEAGLQQLDRLVDAGIPIIVGDLPDMSRALDAKPFAVLRRSQVPTAQMLEKMNARIREWAGAHEQVHLLELALLLQRMRNGEGVEAGGAVWGPEPRLMQHDRLHPTSEGLLAVASQLASMLHALEHPDAEFPAVDKAEARQRLVKRRSAP